MKHYSTRESASILDTTEAEVRICARLGSLTPRRGPGRRLEFSFQELLLLKTTHGLLEAGVPPQRVRRVWSSLRRQLADGIPLTSVTIFADGQRAIAWDGKARWRPDSGQFLLNFDAREIAERAAHGARDGGSVGADERALHKSRSVERAPAAVLPFPAGARGTARAERSAARRSSESARDARPAEPATVDALDAEHWFHIACELEASSPLEAQRAYQHALEFAPDLADAHVNLGRLYHERSQFAAAEAHYREAIRSSPADATPHFNLGVLLETMGRVGEAVTAYEEAVARDPDCADAHYNLGLLLDSLQRRSQAIRHLMIARRLYGSARGR